MMETETLSMQEIQDNVSVNHRDDTQELSTENGEVVRVESEFEVIETKNLVVSDEEELEEGDEEREGEEGDEKAENKEEDKEEEDVEDEGVSTEISANGTKEDKASRKRKVPDSVFTPSLLLPLARVRKIMKRDPEMTIVRAETAQLITKATELFIDHLTKEAFKVTREGSRKTLQYEDVAESVSRGSEFSFLEGLIVKKMKGSEVKKLLAKEKEAKEAKEKERNAEKMPERDSIEPTQEDVVMEE